MIHKMNLHDEPFKKIKNGTKTVEMRLNDEKRRQIKIGDTITFYLMPDLKESITTEVLDLYTTDTFLARIVIPLSLSRSLLSRTSSPSFSCSRCCRA